jgi:VIT1/CCC1 family predicted Fe2+/Mn2+ transporter
VPQTPHIEKHFTAGAAIRDIVIGMSDGLTVPFALAAGLSGAAVGTAVVVTAGLAEIAAGSIAMGLGGYLAARSDAQHYESERRREEAEVRTVPDVEKAEVRTILAQYGLSTEQAATFSEAMAAKPKAFIDFMMRFELQLEEPDPKRALTSALTIAGSYIAGGMIPLSPYILSPTIATAQMISIIVTLVALLVFGYVKARLTGAPPVRGALQTMLVGGIAAGVAFGIARLIG